MGHYGKNVCNFIRVLHNLKAHQLANVWDSPQLQVAIPMAYVVDYQYYVDILTAKGKTMIYGYV